jgi:hypothetical protein
METLRIGSVHEYLAISCPDGPSDEGWMRTRTEIVVDGFRAEIRPWFQSGDFVAFEAPLRKLYESLEGEAKLDPLEEQLVLTLNARTGGHILLTGEARSDWGNRLTFEIEMDQSYLLEPLRVLHAMRDSVDTA